MTRSNAQIEGVIDYVETFWKRNPDMSLAELMERAHGQDCHTFIDDSALMDGLANMELEKLAARGAEKWMTALATAKDFLRCPQDYEGPRLVIDGEEFVATGEFQEV